MYVSESLWFKRQQKRKVILKKAACMVGAMLMLLFFCSCGVCIWQQEESAVAEAANVQQTELSNVNVSQSAKMPQTHKQYNKTAVNDAGIRMEEPIAYQEPLIVIGAGHGGEDEGGSSGEGQEKDMTYTKKMYLTFDDGPSAENTMTVLDILKEQGVKATFFVVGKNVEKNPEVAKRIVEEGHTIGIHCYDHSYDVVYNSVEGYLADFEKAKQAVYEVTGVEAWCFRFPGGSINTYNENIYKEIITEMTKNGYVYYDWNASLEDAVKKTTPEELLKNAKESTLNRKKVVMLAHDIVYNTTLCLEELLEQFPEYEFLPITQDVVPIQF